MNDIDSRKVTTRIWNNGRFKHNGIKIHNNTYDDLQQMVSKYYNADRYENELWYHASLYFVLLGIDLIINPDSFSISLMPFALTPCLISTMNFNISQIRRLIWSFRLISILITFYVLIN